MDRIVTDGCTGFPEKVLGHDLTQCCTVHDGGGSDGSLVDCLVALDPASFAWEALILFCVLLMHFGRPVYNLLQRLGVLPKTDGSKF